MLMFLLVDLLMNGKYAIGYYLRYDVHENTIVGSVEL
mgnify:CR=1 FL=1